jgi:undecaprenyl-diphosphatase
MQPPGGMKKEMIISLFFFSAFTLTAQSFEVRMMRKIHSDSTIFKDKLCRGLSKSVTPLAIAAPSAILLTGFIQKDEAIQREGYRATASLLLSTVLSGSIKYSIKRERPFSKSPEYFCRKCKAGKLSFPSGHTTAAFATATALTLATKKWYVAVPAYTWASGVAYSRMYLGVHYPSDILGGIVIGVGSSFLVWGVDRWMMKK